MSYPEATKFYWEIVRNVSDSSKSKKVFEQDINMFNLDIIEGYVKVRRSDEIIMSCWAVNLIGAQTVPCKLEIKLLSKLPETPKDCKIDSSEKSMIVDCVLGKKIYLFESSIQFTLCRFTSADTNRSLDHLLSISMWRRVNSTKYLINNITSPLSRVKIDNLEPGKLYEILLFTFNKWGESNVVNLTASTIESAFLFGN